MEDNNWHIPVNGVIHVPDELDPLINKIAFQIGFLLHSGKSENETICHIAYAAQKFFSENPELLIYNK